MLIPHDNFIKDKDTDIKLITKEEKDIYNILAHNYKKFWKHNWRNEKFQIRKRCIFKKKFDKNNEKLNLLFYFYEGWDNLNKVELLGIRHKSFWIL